MKVALVSTDNEIWALGLRTISAVLKEAGYKTRIIIMATDQESYNNKSVEELKNLIKEFDIIGISCFSRGSDKAHQVISSLRSLNKIIIWGGLHATLNVDECLQSADLICRGEGERAIIDIIKNLEAGKNLKEIDNLAYKNNGEIKINRLGPLIENLDELPYLDFSFDDEFHLSKKGFNKVSGSILNVEAIIYNGSRGCANNCTYCTNSKLKEIFKGKGKYIRKLNIQKYIEQLKILKNKFPNASYFFFADEDFFSRTLEELRVFSEIYPREVGIPFEVCGSPPKISEEKINLLVSCGLWRIRMGIESGSERTKKEIYNRPITNEIVLRATSIISKFNQVVPYYFLIISNPYETRDDLIETIQFLSLLPSGFFLQIFNLIFFPGTLLYEKAIKDGLISGIKESGYRLDFRAGYYYKEYSWKKKNFYLNGILFFMEGRSTKNRMGLIPRFMLKILIHPKIIKINESKILLIKVAISLRFFTLYLRKIGAKGLKKLIGDPRAVYNLKNFLFNK